MPNLLLIMSWNSSLTSWYKLNIFEREIRIYIELLQSKKIKCLYIISYSKYDLVFNHKLINKYISENRIKIIAPDKYSNDNIIFKLLWSIFSIKKINLAQDKIDISITHQIDGIIPLILGNLRLRSSIIVRSGYIPSLHRLAYKSRYSFSVIIFKFIELIAISLANKILVTSEIDKYYLINRFRSKSNKIKIVKNFVDTDIFRRNLGIIQRDDRILYVGRISKEKNLLNLLKAIKKSSYGLDIIGSGPKYKEIKEYAYKNKIDLNILGNFNNMELPNKYSEYKYFILPSYSEGSPKVLLEAMSIGLVCICSPLNGIKEIIENNKNGILTNGTDANDLYESISNIKKSSYISLSNAARNYILDNHSLTKILCEYHKIINEV